MTEQVAALAKKLDAQRNDADAYRNAWTGDTGPVYMSKESRKNLNPALARLGVNYPRMYVQALADRITIEGFRRRGTSGLDDGLWQLWRAANMRAGSEITHVDYLTYGEAYVTIWAHESDPTTPTVMHDNPRSCYVETDPATGAVTSALRVWRRGNERHALLMTPDRLTRYRAGAGPLTAPGTWTSNGEAIPNPWGSVPLV